MVASKVAGQLWKGPQSLSVDSDSLKLTLLVRAELRTHTCSTLSPPSVFCSAFPAVFFFLSITPFKDRLNQGGCQLFFSAVQYSIV